MQPVLLGHSFFRPSLSFSLYIPSFHLHLFTSRSPFCVLSVCVQRGVNEFLLFLLSYCGLKDAEQQCNKGGSALIKYSNLLSSPFCCGNSAAKIDEALSDIRSPLHLYLRLIVMEHPLNGQYVLRCQLLYYKLCWSVYSYFISFTNLFSLFCM